MTTFTVTINATDYSSRMLYASISPKSLAVGQTSALIFLDNSDGGLNGVVALDMKKRIAIISIDGVEFFRGYALNCRHLYGDTVKGQFGYTVVTRVFCQDYSLDLSNKLISDSYAPALTAHEILDYLVAGTEVTNADACALTVGGLEARREPRINVVQEMCNRTNYDAYVDSTKALKFFAIGTVASGITVVSTDVIYAEYGGDSLDVRNTFGIYGDKTLSLPVDEDWAEFQKDTVAGESHTHEFADYEQVGMDHLMDPGASNYANPIHLTFDCKYDPDIGAGTKAWYKIQYKLGAGAWTDTSTVDVIFGNAAYPNIQTIRLSSDVWDTHPPEHGEDVTVRVLMKVETDAVGSAYIKDFNLYWHNSEAYHVGSTGELTASTTSVKNTYSLKFYDTAVADAHFLTFISHAVSTNVKLNEHGYNKLKFWIYPDLTTGPIDYLQVNLYEDYAANKRFYKMMPCGEGQWNEITLALGVNQDWTEVNTPAWDSIEAIEFIVTSKTAVDNFTIYVDGLYFSEGPQHYTVHDDTSQTDYFQRDYEEEMSVTTPEDITQRGDSLLAKLKDPQTTLHVVVDGSLGAIGGVSKWLPGNTLSVTCASLGLAASIQRMVSIELQCYPRKNVESGHDFVARLDCLGQSAKSYGRVFREAVKATESWGATFGGGAGVGGGGGGSR